MSQALQAPSNEDAKPQLREHLKALILKSCDVQNVSPAQIADDAPLFGGPPMNLTSLDAVEIAVAIEYQFGVDLQNASSVREYFASVNAMTDFIAASAEPEKVRAVLKL